MEFLLGIFLGYLIFSTKGENKSNDGVRRAKITPICKKPKSI